MLKPILDDPTATYRGFRRQALYCLYRVFDDGLLADAIILPEGNEDLEIQNNLGVRLEVVQVKDYTADLTASAFKPSFYQRISNLCTNDSSVTIRISSFGKIGPELKKAYDNSQETPARALNTLTKDRDEKNANGETKTFKGLSVSEAQAVFRRVEIEVVDEETLTKHIVEKLALAMTSGEPEVAFENLMWWLISAAEKRKHLTRSLTIEKITQLGKFISHRNAHSKEWNVSIKPIESDRPKEQASEKLRIEFFQGGRVKPKHVAARLDVPRENSIAKIHQAFQDENVVILRGASGQGKTTLAYRYLLDWAPSDFRYQVERAASLVHARAIATAVAGHAEAIDAPTIIFIDVRPGDGLWVEIVRELAGVGGIRVLVTIREDDWFRSGVSTEDFEFSDIEMDFTEETAGQIYKELRKLDYGNGQLDFKDAWTKLGNRKTLFEFVYLVTQNERLSNRVRTQIAILKDEVNRGDLDRKELHLLRLVAVASAYEARLDLKSLVNYIELAEPTRSLERFGNEYLLRTSMDGKHVEGFHAIRSEIIADELTDPVVQTRGMIESILSTLVVEDDIESLLLCSFSRNEDAAYKVVEGLNGIQLNTWVGVRGVLIALQWLGIRLYTVKNMELIKDVRSRSSTGWWMVLDWDLAQVFGNEGGGLLQKIAQTTDLFNSAAIDEIRSFQDRQSEKEEVFEYARDWLTLFKLPLNAPDSIADFSSVGEVFFWLGHLNQYNQAAASILDDRILSDAWRALPLHLFSNFALGVQKYNTDIYKNWLKQNRATVERRVRAESAIIAFVEDNECFEAHYVIDFDRKASDLIPSEEEKSVNDLAIQRIKIIAACLPGYERYGSAGYGHRMSLFESFGDESIKRLPVENIPLPWLPKFNSLARGSVEYSFRSSSWHIYFSNVRELRENVLNIFSNLRVVLAKDGNFKLLDTEMWDKIKHSLSGDFLIPKLSVDEWGFVSESSTDQTNSIDRKFTAITTLEPFNRAFNKYTNSLSNFFSQVLQALALMSNLRLAKTEEERRAILDKGAELGVHQNSIRLSVVNGIDACVALRELRNIERCLKVNERMGFQECVAAKELDQFLLTLNLWMLFCYPDQMLPTASKQKKNSRKKTNSKRGSELRSCLQATANRITHDLRKLKKSGIDAKILNEEVKWNGELSLWICFDTEHPIGSLIAVEKIWKVLIEAFRPDRNKIARTKAIEFLWPKIVLVPLIQGRSLDGQAYANIHGVSNPLDEDLAKQLWRFVPEDVPQSAWTELGLARWELGESGNLFDEFAAAYTTTFQHVDHLADFSRCNVDLDESGTEIFLEYARLASTRVDPFVQKTFDSCKALLEYFSDIAEDVAIERPNIVGCMALVVQMEDAIHPSDDFDETGALTFTCITDWRNRLKDSLNLLGQAQAFWRADQLRLAEYDFSKEASGLE